MLEVHPVVCLKSILCCKRLSLGGSLDALPPGRKIYVLLLHPLRQVEKLEIYYDPTPFLDDLSKGGKCPFMSGKA